MAGETTSNASPSLSPLRLTEWTSCGGCAAKWGANLLKDLVDDLAAGAKPNIDPALLVGLAPFDDAAVYQISDDVALVSTTDFFPPLVDDPDDFGAIAATMNKGAEEVAPRFLRLLLNGHSGRLAASAYKWI